MCRNDLSDEWLVEKERRETQRLKQLKNQAIGNFEARLPIIRNCEPMILSDMLVGVTPVGGTIKYKEPSK